MQFTSLTQARQKIGFKEIRNLIETAQTIAKEFRQKETELINILQKLDATKAYRATGYNSLFQFCVESLELTEHQAYNYITVARKCTEVPELMVALEDRRITVSKARRMASVVNSANQKSWIALAEKSSQRDLEKAVRAKDPQAPARDHLQILSQTEVKLQATLKRPVEEKLRRVLELISEKTHAHVTLILHRDSRYAFAAKFAGAGELIQIQNEDIRELKLYEKALKKLALKLALTAKNTSTKPPEHALSPIKKIGLLVGGGKSATGTFYEKRWPRLSELIHIILHETNFQISLFGGQDDIKSANNILNLLSDEMIASGRIDNLVGTVALSNLSDQLRELDAFISVDSGLAHIAAAVMTAPHQKVITLFGPTDPHLWAPTARGKAQSIDLYKFENCSPCYQNDGHFKHCIYSGNDFQKCMTAITPEDVLEALIGD